MGTDPRAIPRTTEDLELNLLPGGPRDYANTTDKSLRYVEVANEDGVLGYLWAADEDDAASFVPRSAAGGAAMRAWGSWKHELRQCKERDLLPSRALAELSDGAGNEKMGRVVPGSQAEAPNHSALKDFASRG